MNDFAAPAHSHLPRHVAFIMDGNGRWATRRGLGRLLGHSQGVEAVRRVCEELVKLGVPYATFYAFSTENWQRPLEEVSGLFGLMRSYFKKELATIIEKGLRVRFIGDRRLGGKLEADLLALMEEVEAKTAHNTKLHVTFAINYSGRDELVRVMQGIAADAAAGKIVPEQVDAAAVEQRLDTHGLPAPDLMIRTSGEQRISNFLLWQLAYAEFYFCEVAWPDFQATHLQAALAAFAGRERRFGSVPAAVAA
ncbi:MAG: di-trans,poly-cis-decaprenylcistransferase [Proteobacteria bacterium]|nr:di-trans,poly-cis-decaprenylcistransferase [Pseudomonadota bacterium]